MTVDDLIKLVDRHASELGEHFDSVQVLVSNSGSEGTENIYSGVGNWFARQGMAHDFITKDSANTHANKIGDRLDPPDDSEAWKKP